METENYLYTNLETYQDDIDEMNDVLENALNTIKELKAENERLKEQNNDLRKIYRNTYQRLFNNGNDELAGYFQAQINDCPTFYVEPIIDYHKEWKDYKSRCEKAIEYINNNKQILIFADLRKEDTHQYTLECDADDLLNILNGSDKNE